MASIYPSLIFMPEIVGLQLNGEYLHKYSSIIFRHDLNEYEVFILRCKGLEDFS